MTGGSNAAYLVGMEREMPSGRGAKPGAAWGSQSPLLGVLCSHPPASTPTPGEPSNNCQNAKLGRRQELWGVPEDSLLS